VIGQGVWILWGVENCHLPLTKPVAIKPLRQGWRYRAARDIMTLADPKKGDCRICDC